MQDRNDSFFSTSLVSGDDSEENIHKFRSRETWMFNRRRWVRTGPDVLDR